ncbi:MAG: HlyC/CorC family transporter [Pirellulales bacterium]|nr:HlyC/CorC family transporter [Pirellulales bacterium]
MSHDAAVFWLAVLGLIATCVAAVAARSLASFSRHDLEEICNRRGAKRRLSAILRRHEQVGLAAETVQVIATAIVILAGAFWTWRLAPHAPDSPHDWSLLAASVVVGAALLMAVEIWIPWAVARLWATGVVYVTWPLWQAAATILTPAMFGARFVDGFLRRLAGRTPEPLDEETFEDEIRTIVTEGHREGLLEEDAREMIEGVIELGDVDVSEIMTPRTDMVSIPVSLSWREMLDFVIGQGHTRIPAHDKNRDDVVGVLFVKDLLPELAKDHADGPQPWTPLLRDPYFVPETKPIDVLLQEFQRTRHHMAIVLDEYGGVSGLVTLEDVLEEIVGEITDEYDKDLVDGIKPLGKGAAEVLGGVHIDEVNERLGLALPDGGDFDTIAGLVFSGLGHVPQVGEELQQNNVRLRVLEATRRRILRVRIESVDPNHHEP